MIRKTVFITLIFSANFACAQTDSPELLRGSLNEFYSPYSSPTTTHNHYPQRYNDRKSRSKIDTEDKKRFVESYQMPSLLKEATTDPELRVQALLPYGNTNHGQSLTAGSSAKYGVRPGSVTSRTSQSPFSGQSNYSDANSEAAQVSGVASMEALPSAKSPDKRATGGLPTY